MASVRSPLLTSPAAALAFTAGLVLAFRWVASTPLPQPPAPPPHVNPKVLALFDRLSQVSDQGIGTHATAWASGFLAVDDEPGFHGGVLGSQRPVEDDAMRELVRRGGAAIRAYFAARREGDTP